MMDTYSNMITMNTILLEQHKKSVETQQGIIRKQEDIVVKQEDIINKLSKTSENIADLKLTLTTHKSEYTEQHGKLSTKVQIAMYSMGTVIVSLIGLIYTIISHNSLISKIYDIVIKLASSAGV